MNKDLSLWQFISERLTAKLNVMLLIVAESSGSSPGRQGFKMAVGEDHFFAGSIGGGIMEVKLVELAKEMLKEKISDPGIKKQIHRKNEPRDQSGMICSGEQTVIYFYLTGDHLQYITDIIGILGKYESALIKISCIRNISTFTVSHHLTNAKSFEFTKDGDHAFTWQEYIGYKHQLYIVGGGHCALALSELMSKFDFYIHVMDDRPGLNTIDQNTFAHEKHLLDNYEQVEERIPSGKDVCVVVMTLGYRSDLIVLLSLAGKTFGYIGLMGSESKVTSIKEEFSKSGKSTSILQQMHAPVGLKINSHTPEEIAVSIAAQLISVKNANVLHSDV